MIVKTITDTRTTSNPGNIFFIKHSLGGLATREAVLEKLWAMAHPKTSTGEFCTRLLSKANFHNDAGNIEKGNTYRRLAIQTQMDAHGQMFGESKNLENFHPRMLMFALWQFEKIKDPTKKDINSAVTAAGNLAKNFVYAAKHDELDLLLETFEGFLKATKNFPRQEKERKLARKIEGILEDNYLAVATGMLLNVGRRSRVDDFQGEVNKIVNEVVGKMKDPAKRNEAEARIRLRASYM